MHPHTIHCDDYCPFLLDPGLSREDNFVQWQEANRIEREAWGDLPYTEAEARGAFNLAVSNGWLKYRDQEEDQRKTDRS